MLRGWMLGICSAALAVSAHGMAGGGVPDTALSVPLIVLVAWAGTRVAGGRRQALGLLGVLAVTQTVLHLLLSELAHGGHEHGPPVAGVVMFAAHAVATVLTALLLARASTALALVSCALDWLLRGLRALWFLPAARSRKRITPTPAPARPGLVLEVLLRRVCARRGPPAHS